jgi:hypothetical protein
MKQEQKLRIQVDELHTQNTPRPASSSIAARANLASAHNAAANMRSLVLKVRPFDLSLTLSLSHLPISSLSLISLSRALSLSHLSHPRARARSLSLSPPPPPPSPEPHTPSPPSQAQSRPATAIPLPADGSTPRPGNPGALPPRPKADTGLGSAAPALATKVSQPISSASASFSPSIRGPLT